MGGGGQACGPALACRAGRPAGVGEGRAPPSSRRALLAAPARLGRVVAGATRVRSIGLVSWGCQIAAAVGQVGELRANSTGRAASTAAGAASSTPTEDRRKTP